MQGPGLHDFVSKAQFIKAIEKAAHMAASNAAALAARAISQVGAAPIRGVVTDVDADNKVQIRRYTSINLDGTEGDPDPQYYQLLSPGVIPGVGSEVHGITWSGGVQIIGEAIEAGYRDIPAVDASVGAVRAGGVDDFSLVNAKYATNSADARMLSPDAVGASEVQNSAIGNSEAATGMLDERVAGFDSVGSNAIRTLSVNNPEAGNGMLDERVAGFDSVGGNALKSDSVGASELQSDTVGGSELQSNAVSNENVVTNMLNERVAGFDSVGANAIRLGSVNASELSNDSVGDAKVINFSLAGSVMQNSAIGTREANSASISFVGHTHSSTNFVRYSKEMRQEMLDRRLDLQSRIRPASHEELLDLIELVAANVEIALKLHMDYIHMDAFQREDKLESDPEWAGQYVDHYRVGMWSGFEPLQTLDLVTQEERRIKSIEDPQELGHVHATNRPVW